MASVFRTGALNHSSDSDATIVRPVVATVSPMAAKNDYISRLQIALAAAGTTKQALASGIGISPQAVNKLYAGTSKALSARNNSKAAAWLGVDPDWLATGEGESTPRYESFQKQEPLPRAGDNTLAHDMSLSRPMIAPTRISWESLMSRPLPPLFLLTMPDDALGDVAPQGREFIFSTVENDPPESANVVLVKDGANRHYCRIYEEGRGDSWRAIAITAGYRPLDSVEDKLEVVAIGMGPWGRRR
jgi:transcriptional regulator with XRE-family HTH domain